MASWRGRLEKFTEGSWRSEVLGPIIGLGRREPEEADLAVAFYDQGRLLKQYSTADLVQDKTAVVRTGSHYFWKARAPVLDPQNVFHLQTIDGIVYEFDATTGTIKKRSRRPTQTNANDGN